MTKEEETAKAVEALINYMGFGHLGVGVAPKTRGDKKMERKRVKKVKEAPVTRVEFDSLTRQVNGLQYNTVGPTFSGKGSLEERVLTLESMVKSFEDYLGVDRVYTEKVPEKPARFQLRKRGFFGRG